MLFPLSYCQKAEKGNRQTRTKRSPHTIGWPKQHHAHPIGTMAADATMEQVRKTIRVFHQKRTLECRIRKLNRSA